MSEQLPPLDKPQAIAFPHLDGEGQPLATLENVQAVMAAYKVIIARPPHCNSDSFTAWFGIERYQACAEHQRDCHREQLRAMCLLNGMDDKALTHENVARFVTLLGLEQENDERQDSNEQRLQAVGAL